jgi:hypothetical protein
LREIWVKTAGPTGKNNPPEGLPPPQTIPIQLLDILLEEVTRYDAYFVSLAMIFRAAGPTFTSYHELWM